jgi:hypothetical protein
MLWLVAAVVPTISAHVLYSRWRSSGSTTFDSDLQQVVAVCHVSYVQTSAAVCPGYSAGCAEHGASAAAALGRPTH